MTNPVKSNIIHSLITSAEDGVYHVKVSLDSLNSDRDAIKDKMNIAKNDLAEVKEKITTAKTELSKLNFELLKARAKLSASLDAESLATSELGSLRKELADEKNKFHTSRSERDVWIAKVERGLADPGSITNKDMDYY